MKKLFTVLMACFLIVSMLVENYSFAFAATNNQSIEMQNEPSAEIVPAEEQGTPPAESLPAEEQSTPTTEAVPSEDQSTLPVENIPEEVTNENEIITPYAVTYEVNFFNWDNTQLGVTQNIEEGNAAVAPAVPDRPGYQFTGWSEDFSSVNQKMDIYAQYTPLLSYTITINYIFADSTIALQPVIYSVEQGSNFNQTVSTPAIPGYIPDQNQVVIDLLNVQADQTYTVVFTASSTTPYKVEHYQQNLVLTNPSNPLDPANFTLIDTDNLTGQTNSLTTAISKNYTGFTPPAVLPAAQIAADGSTTLKTYYTRNQYAIYFDTAGGNYIVPIAALYGEAITPPANPTRQGYAFTSWSSSFPATMPANDVTLTANWTPSGASNYTLVYWLENTGSTGYDYVGTASASGTAGAAPIIPGSVPSGVTFPIASTYYTYNGIKTNSEKPATINGNGTTIVNVYYDRNTYTLNFNFDASKYKVVVGSTTYTTSPYQISAKYGASINAKWPSAPILLPGKQGDGTFTGWLGDDIHYVTTQFYLDSNLINNAPFTATWNKKSKNVTVYYNFQNLTGGGYTSKYTQTVAVEEDSTSWNAKSFIGFTVQQATVEIQPNNTATFYYNRNAYNVTYYNGGTIDKTVSNVLYEAPISGTNFNYTPPRPANIPSDYTFAGWYTTAQGFDNSRFDFLGTTMPAYNLIVYSRWDKPQYTVTFNPDNGSPTTSQTVNSLDTVTPITEPTKPGYAFGGWYLPGATLKYVFNFPVTSNMTLTARWISINNITYDVVYKKEGVEHLRQTFGSKSIGDSVTAMAITIPGYLPDALSKSLTLEATGNEIVFNYVPFSNIGYTVKYVDENNVPLSMDKVASSNQASVTENYINISGYYPNFYQQTLQLTPNAADNVITFLYKKNAPVNYLVRTYMENIGGGYSMTEETKSAPAGSLVQETPQTILGFTFNPDLSIMSRIVASNGSTVVVIFYDRNMYDINFTIQGQGTLLGTPSFDDVKYGTPFGSAGVVPTPVPNPGYKFDGWQAALPGAGDLITSEATYTAVFSKDLSQWATITYDGNTHTNGTMPPSTDLLIGSTFVLPANAFTKTNYDFLNWDTSPNATGDYTFMNQETITVTGDMTLYAQWSEHDKWRVAYINNGGYGDMHDDTVYYDGDTVTVQSNILTKPGYSFKEWKSLGGTVYQGGQVFAIHEDTLLIAQWEYDADQWSTIGYDKNHPSATGTMTEDTILLGEAYTLKSNAYTLENYTFEEWNTQADGNGVGYADGYVFSSLGISGVLYAQWEENPKYTIEYVANNGTADTIVEAPAYAGTIKTILSNDAFTYANNDLIRWNTSPDGTGDTYLVGSSTTLSQNVTLYAMWKERNLYTVTYNDGYSTGTFTNSQYAEADGNVDIVIANNPYIRPGYVFKDWISTMGAIAYPGNIMYDAQASYTYTAEWEPIAYSIAYELNGGTLNGVNPNQYNMETPTFDLINPTKPGYIFDGWTQGLTPGVNTPGNQTITIGQGSMGDLGYTANWVKDPSQWSKITFVNSDPAKGTLDGTLTYEGLKGDPTTAIVNYPTTTGARGYIWDQWSEPIPSAYPNQDVVITGYWIKDPSQWSKITFVNSDPAKGTLDGIMIYEGLKGDPTTAIVDYPTTTGARGYIWDRWSEPIPSAYPNQDVIITGYWIKDPSQWSKITFVNSDPAKGTLDGTLTYEGIKGDSTTEIVNYPTTTNAQGYIWDRWSEPIPSAYPNQDIVITGYWKAVVEPPVPPTPVPPTPIPVTPINADIGKKEEVQKSKTPKTGDTSGAYPIVLMGFGALAIAISKMKKRRQK